MAPTDLQRLFRLRPTEASTHLEDFTSAAFVKAINRDLRPFIGLLAAIPATAWRSDSGRLTLDLTNVRSAVAEPQVSLSAITRYDAARLDVVVQLEDDVAATDTVWIEVKIDAAVSYHRAGDRLLERLPPECAELAGRPGRDQLDVYLLHRCATPASEPKPILITLSKSSPLRDDITGTSWEDVVVAVGATEGADPWWHDLVDFLRAEGVVPDRLPPCVTGVDPAALLPVYLGANRVLRELWDADPFNIHFVGIEGRVRRGQRLFTGGPIVWGLRVSDDGCEWWVAIGNAGHPGVSVTYDAVVDAARAGGLPDTWLPSEDYLWDRFLVFDKRRAFVAGEHTDDVVRLFFSPAFRELHAARMLKPHFDKTREKQARDSQRRTERERGKAGPLTT